jgi:hypothetical protein
MVKPDALRAEADACRRTAAAIRTDCLGVKELPVNGFLTMLDRALELEREAIRLEAQAQEREQASERRRSGWWSFWQPAG